MRARWPHATPFAAHPSAVRFVHKRYTHRSAAVLAGATPYQCWTTSLVRLRSFVSRTDTHMLDPATTGPLPAHVETRLSAARVRSLRTRGAAHLPGWLQAVLIVAILGGALTSNAALTAAALVVLALLLRVLRRPGESPVLLFAVGMQWAQVTAKVFEADYQGVPVDDLGHSIQLSTAIWLGLAGVAVLAIGMHAALRSLRTPPFKEVDAGARSLSTDRIFVLYLVTLAIGIGTQPLLWRMLPIAEALRALGEIRWAFYFLLGFHTLRWRRNTTYFLAATAIELLAGIGYFSSFKTVLFMAIIVAIASGRRVNVRSLTVVMIAGTATVVFALAWQSVKGQYRKYLNQGTHQQVALVSTEAQVQTFGTMMTSVDSRQLTGAVPSLLDRLAYVDFFADVLDHVPAALPHEGGALLWRAIVHVLTPRILFPDKPVLESDSEETMRYTGRVLASGAEGTSFSLGYMVEQYIDFGYWGMFLPIFLIGLAWGGIYRYCMTRPFPAAFNIAFAAALMIYVDEFEMAEIKLIGGTLMRFIVFALFMRLALPGLVVWLRATRTPDRLAS